MTPPTTDSGRYKRNVIEEADRIATLDGAALARLMKDIEDHEERLREMEKWQWKMMGVGLCVGFAMTVFVGIATSMITDDIRQLRKDLAPVAAGRNR